MNGFIKGLSYGIIIVAIFTYLIIMLIDRFGNIRKKDLVYDLKTAYMFVIVFLITSTIYGGIYL